MADMIQQITYASEVPGPRLLVLGGVHGNETCGPIAIRRALQEFENGTLRLERGQVTFVPVCNPEAARQNVRFVDRNLNRFLVPTDNPTTYEARLGNILCPLLERCDVLLDLHSSHEVGDEAFVFVNDPSIARERAFAACLGPRKLATGWEDAYAAAGRKPADNPDEPTGTTEYSRRFGAMSVTLECGSHNDAASADVGYRAIRNALRHLGMTESPDASIATQKILITARMVTYLQKPGRFAKPWTSMQSIPAGEIIARYDDGEDLRAAEDGYIIMPRYDCPIGQEWFYWGTE